VKRDLNFLWKKCEKKKLFGNSFERMMNFFGRIENMERVLYQTIPNCNYYKLSGIEWSSILACTNKYKRKNNIMWKRKKNRAKVERDVLATSYLFTILNIIT
jgi:hypothetical protein